MLVGKTLLSLGICIDLPVSSWLDNVTSTKISYVGLFKDFPRLDFTPTKRSDP